MFKQLIPNLAKTKQYNQAIFHSCLQINEANITECYIHCYLQTLTLLILIFLAYLIFTEFEHPSMFLLL